MRLFLFSLMLLFISGCMGAPKPSSSKEDIAKDQIQFNKAEAEKAQEEYIELQKQRNNN